MKITLQWLKEYVDYAGSPDDLREQLTLLGLEVEAMHKKGGAFEGVVVAQVLARDKHPNADKLSVCRVTDGRGERQIVCGATNFQAGDKVPLALPGCTLPTPAGAPPVTIKIGRLRGVESQGMMCSPIELGMGADASGLMILPPDARVGQPFVEYLGQAGGDVVYDLEITPNRPDLNSVIGIAREISALTGQPLQWPEVLLPVPAEPGVEAWVAVRIEDPVACPRYTARLVRGVKVGPSPDWLRQRLEQVGLRSINNVVDVTNFVMLEVGQPLHAFDYHLLSAPAGAPSPRPTIVVRHAGSGEKFITLDGQERTLTDRMLLIADETKAVAVAGVMGGLNSEINERTVDVLLESACFQPQSIRATSKKLGLTSDAAYRFERGSDVQICDWASQRAVQLILATAGGQAAAGVVDVYPQPAAPREITLRHARTNQLLGIELPADQQTGYLRQLGLVVLRQTDGPASAVTVQVPSFRVDLKREADLIEEIGRLYGVDRIPSRIQIGALGSHPFDRVFDDLTAARRLLTGLGLTETQGQTLIPETAARLLAGVTPILLANPLSADMNVLRPSLLPGLLAALRHNAARQTADAACFELGRVFTLVNGAPQEQLRLALALTGHRHLPFWSGADREAMMDVYDLKGVLDEFLAQFGVQGVTVAPQAGPGPLFLESAVIQQGRNPIGEFGQLLPALAKQHDLREAVLIAELNLDLILARRNAGKSFKALPAYPAIRRDVAMLVAEPVTHDAVLAVVRKAKPMHLEKAELFDVFRGRNVPAGQKSLAYAFTYRHADRTLTDAEVNAVHQRLVEQLQQQLPAAIREG